MIRHLPGWTDLDELTPEQNRWMKVHILPPLFVNFETWAKTQPTDFKLDYLLDYALKNKWDLTPAGWKKVEEMGLQKDRERTEEATPSEYEGWLRNKDAAERLRKSLSIAGIKRSFETCKSKICKARDRNRLATNGIKGTGCLYDPIGVDALALKIRDTGLPDEEDDEEDEGY